MDRFLEEAVSKHKRCSARRVNLLIVVLFNNLNVKTVKCCRCLFNKVN